jgi:hypothetical protein
MNKEKRKNKEKEEETDTYYTSFVIKLPQF